MKRLVCSLAVVASLSAFAAIEMGAPFTEGAVLQRGMKVPVWGKARPGSEVTVCFADSEVTAVACEGGCWKVELPAMAASKEGRTMTVTEAEPGWFGSTTDAVEIKDILVGEVWLASGQSNMECPIWGAGTRYRDGKGGFMTAMTHLPSVRYVKIPRTWSPTPLARQAKWCRFVPAEFPPEANGSRNYLSAVAFYYARELYLALDVPVGIVDASWGGTNIDAWTPRCAYGDCDPSIKATADYVVKDGKAWKKETDRKGPVSSACQQPTVLWNGMVAAFAPMATRGFIWYQGCHNSGESSLYRAKLHALYNGWSREFKNPDLKFYLVQLAPFSQNWMGICTAQNQFVGEQRNAALAVTSDVGNFDDIHPNDKETVAKRLALHALKRDYGFDSIAEDDSPVFRSAAYGADGRVTLAFDHVTNWYVYAPDRSRNAAFEVAGADGVWQPAKIVNFRQGKKDGKTVDTDYIDASEIVVKSEKVVAPVKVRYMGRKRTAGTLYNQVSLPLGPFEAAK